MEDDITAEQQELALATAGDRLRDAREKMSLSLEQVAADTRIPIRHLEAIEGGRLDKLPARTYAIGFSRTYAQLLELDDAEIADLVRAELAAMDTGEQYRANAMEPGDAAKVPSSRLAWFGAIAAILLVAGLLAVYSTYFAAGEGPPSLLDSERVVAADTDNGVAVEQVDDAVATVDADGQVVFTALEDGVWVRISENSGDRLLEKIMEKGESFELPAEAQDPRINTGRPDAFAITIGGLEVPKLADEPITIGDAQISATALLARELTAQP